MKLCLRSWVAGLLVPVLLVATLVGAAQMTNGPQQQLKAATLSLLAVDPLSLCGGADDGMIAGDHCPICYLVKPTILTRALPASHKARLTLPARREYATAPHTPRPVRDPALGLRAPPVI